MHRDAETVHGTAACCQHFRLPERSVPHFTPAPRLPPCYPTTMESFFFNIFTQVFIFPHIFASQTRKVRQHSVKQQVHSVFTDSWFLPSSRDTSTEFSEYQVGPVAAGATNGVHFKYVGSIALYIGPLLFIRSTYSSITSWNDTTGLILHQPSSNAASSQWLFDIYTSHQCFHSKTGYVHS